VFGSLVPTETLLGRWRLTTDLFGRVFCDDVGAEPGSVISELGGFAVKESKFRREMERLRNSQQRDLTLEVHSAVSVFCGHTQLAIPSGRLGHKQTRHAMH